MILGEYLKMPHIAQLTNVPLREIWKHEANDFTCWLADNLDYLEEATGLKLQLEEREASAGDFAADILALESDGNAVIIENQLDKTDHDHLGKLLTYMVNLDAKIAIWITSQPRAEHEKVVQWLNGILPDDSGVYLVQIEAFRIGDSPAAAKFTLVSGPSEESRAYGAKRKKLAERNHLQLEFWKSLLEKIREKTHLHANISPSKSGWISTGAGMSGLGYVYVVLKDAGRVELYIDTRIKEMNKSYFDQLKLHKEEIEREFGSSMRWERLDDRQISRISYDILDKGGLRDKNKWPELQDAMIDAMIRLEKSFCPRIKELA
jgi:hypothetical protein